MFFMFVQIVGYWIAVALAIELLRAWQKKKRARSIDLSGKRHETGIIVRAIINILVISAVIGPFLVVMSEFTSAIKNRPPELQNAIVCNRGVPC